MLLDPDPGLFGSRKRIRWSDPNPGNINPDPQSCPKAFSRQNKDFFTLHQFDALNCGNLSKSLHEIREAAKEITVLFLVARPLRGGWVRA